MIIFDNQRFKHPNRLLIISCATNAAKTTVYSLYTFLFVFIGKIINSKITRFFAFVVFFLRLMILAIRYMFF